MSVVSIESNKSFKFHGRRADQELPERPLKRKTSLLSTIYDYSYFPLGIAVAAWLPTGFWCAELQNPLPAFLIATSELIGTIIGVVIYRNGPPPRESCAPVTMLPDKKPTATAHRKAA